MQWGVPLALANKKEKEKEKARFLQLNEGLRVMCILAPLLLHAPPAALFVHRWCELGAVWISSFQFTLLKSPASPCCCLSLCE